MFPGLAVQDVGIAGLIANVVPTDMGDAVALSIMSEQSPPILLAGRLVIQTWSN